MAKLKMETFKIALADQVYHETTIINPPRMENTASRNWQHQGFGKKTLLWSHGNAVNRRIHLKSTATRKLHVFALYFLGNNKILF